ncbi:MAG TPA: hypothetical protein VJ276_00590 [Thermoanaerobaculia bacterium]|nr:hypothetical protein [Thermoanaerobaculia bacterium]
MSIGRALVFALTLSGFLSAASGTPLHRATTIATKRKGTQRARKFAKVREELHRNLDGKGSGFIQGWSFNANVFTLTVDKSRYQQHAIYAAAMTARAIFDSNGVPLPTTLVFRDASGELLGEGPFVNVPKLVD